ncbi:MAG: hypothetical protein SGILL_000232 [Bacillariaceae sp.]
MTRIVPLSISHKRQLKLKLIDKEVNESIKKAEAEANKQVPRKPTKSKATICSVGCHAATSTGRCSCKIKFQVCLTKYSIDDATIDGFRFDGREVVLEGTDGDRYITSQLAQWLQENGKYINQSNITLMSKQDFNEAYHRMCNDLYFFDRRDRIMRLLPGAYKEAIQAKSSSTNENNELIQTLSKVVVKHDESLDKLSEVVVKHDESLDKLSEVVVKHADKFDRLVTAMSVVNDKVEKNAMDIGRHDKEIVRHDKDMVRHDDELVELRKRLVSLEKIQNKSSECQPSTAMEAPVAPKQTHPNVATVQDPSKKRSAEAMSTVDVSPKQASKKPKLSYSPDALQKAYGFLQKLDFKGVDKAMQNKALDTFLASKAVKTAYNAWKKDASKAEKAAVESYIKGSFKSFNLPLCDGRALTADNQIHHDNILQLFEKLPAYVGPVYRGMGELSETEEYWPKMIADILSKGEYHERGFTSSSLLSFTQQTDLVDGSNIFAGRRCLMRIQSKTGRNIQKFARCQVNEFEVLFAPGTRFKVNHHEQKGQQHIFEMEEIVEDV